MCRATINYIDALRAPGRVTAKIYAGVESKDGEENGFMAHTQNNPFGWTCPGWNFDWGWSPAAVPWILQNCWEYYDFTRNADYLKEKIYPMMKEEATLYDQILIKDADGKLVSSPSYSPEHGPKTSGNTYEQTLVWQLYQDTIEAAGAAPLRPDLDAINACTTHEELAREMGRLMREGIGASSAHTWAPTRTIPPLHGLPRPVRNRPARRGLLPRG